MVLVVAWFLFFVRKQVYVWGVLGCLIFPGITRKSMKIIENKMQPDKTST